MALVILLALIVAAGYAGLRMKPARFPAYTAARTAPIERVPLRDDLPAPVAQFYRTILDGADSVPVIHSAVMTGTARLRFNGIMFNSRYRFVYDLQIGYRHYIESTLFGQPVLKANEFYLEGASRLELPFGVFDNDPKQDSAANLGFWGEMMWLPTVYITDPRARWEAIDANSARLVVPFGGDTQAFTVRFDPETHLIARMETMRYRDTSEDPIAWILEPRGWKEINGMLIPTPSAVTWADESAPWSVWAVDNLALNAPVDDYIRQRGL